MREEMTSIRMLLGFFAGFAAVLVFQQPVLALLHALHIAARAPYSSEMTMPMGLPAVWALAFWGGVWGVVLAAIDNRFGRGRALWESAMLFGAIVPTAFEWFIVLVGTHKPIGGQMTLGIIVTPLLINAAWGIGTEAIVTGLSLALMTEA